MTLKDFNSLKTLGVNFGDYNTEKKYLVLGVNFKAKTVNIQDIQSGRKYNLTEKQIKNRFSIKYGH